MPMMSQPSMDAAAGGRTIADVLHRQAAARPHDPAFVCRNQTVSWAEAASRCDGLAAHLAKVVKPGGRVAVVTRACHRYWETLFACASAGVVAVPINYRWRPSEIADVLADCGATALVADLGLLRGEDRDLVLAGIGSAVGFNGNDPRVEPYELV